MLRLLRELGEQTPGFGRSCPRFDLFFVQHIAANAVNANAASAAAEAVDNDANQAREAEQLRWMASAARNCSLFGGHFDASFPSRVLGVRSQPRLVTFLRDPVARFLSSFRYDVAARGFRGSLLDYVREYPTRHVCNYQVTFLRVLLFNNQFSLLVP